MSLKRGNADLIKCDNCDLYNNSSHEHCIRCGHPLTGKTSSENESYPSPNPKNENESYNVKKPKFKPDLNQKIKRNLSKIKSKIPKFNLNPREKSIVIFFCVCFILVIILPSPASGEFNQSGIYFHYPYDGVWSFSAGDLQKGELLIAKQEFQEINSSLKIEITKKNSSESIDTVKNNWVEKIATDLKSKGYRNEPLVEKITIDGSPAYFIKSFLPEDSLKSKYQFAVIIFKKDDNLYEIFFTGKFYTTSRYGTYLEPSIVTFINTLKIVD